MPIELLLKILDLLYKVVKGQNPRAKTEIQLSSGLWETYFNIPSLDGNDYPKNGISRVHFEIDFVLSHPSAETIHEAKLFLRPRQGGRATELFPPSDIALLHSGGQDLGNAIQRFVEKHSAFQPFNIEASNSVRVVIPAYSDLPECTIRKTEDDAWVLVALRIGTKWMVALTKIYLGGTKGAEIHRSIRWEHAISENSATKLISFYENDSQRFGAVASSIAPMKFY